MKEKLAVITGSTCGIVREFSRILAAQGWNLVLLNRSRIRSENHGRELAEAFPEQSFTAYTADFLDLGEIEEVATEIGVQHPKIDALYNVAGILTDQRITSAQGIEGHFAVNVVAPYLLLQKLRVPLAAGGEAGGKSVIAIFSSSAIYAV